MYTTIVTGLELWFAGDRPKRWAHHGWRVLQPPFRAAAASATVFRYEAALMGSVQPTAFEFESTIEPADKISIQENQDPQQSTP